MKHSKTFRHFKLRSKFGRLTDNEKNQLDIINIRHWSPPRTRLSRWEYFSYLRRWRRERSRVRAVSPSFCRKSDSLWQRSQCERLLESVSIQRKTPLYTCLTCTQVEGGREGGAGIFPSCPGISSRNRAPLCGHSLQVRVDVQFAASNIIFVELLHTKM